MERNAYDRQVGEHLSDTFNHLSQDHVDLRILMKVHGKEPRKKREDIFKLKNQFSCQLNDAERCNYHRKYKIVSK